MGKYKKTEKSRNAIIIIRVILSLAILVIDSLIPLGVAGGVPYIIVILFSLWSNRKKFPIYIAIGCTMFTTIGLYLSPAGGELWMVLSNRLLALFAIWTVTILSVKRKNIYEEKEKALSEVNILRGLLPICASCKRIRDYKGYWGAFPKNDTMIPSLDF